MAETHKTINKEEQAINQKITLVYLIKTIFYTAKQTNNNG
jgi:hypothetical protein